MKLPKHLRPTPRIFIIAAAAALLSACGPSEADLKLPPPPKTVTEVDLERFVGESIGEPIGERRPWVAHVRAVDLDEDGLLDVIACESKDSEVLWIRQQPDGSFEEIVIASDAQAPVHAEVYDLDLDGDLDVLVSSMNIVFPNNDKIGALIALENDGSENFTQRILLEKVERVVDARAADMDKDGDLDIVVGQFGYDQGEVRWMRNDGNWNYTSEITLRLSGTVNVTIDDYNGDGWLDFAALVSQQWEEIHLFENDAQGGFRKSRVIWGSTNDDYAISGMSSADLNRDGKPDLVFTNGDGFGPNPVPGPRPWHGVQWLENKGNGFFKYNRIGDLGGAYSPLAVDIDHDGDMDVLALSSFNDWSNPKAESMMLYRNDGDMKFTPVVLAYNPIQLLTLDAGDFDGSGRFSLVTGGFHAYTPYERMSRLMIWRPQE
ncbi:FG-GAP-like repeat-containing protein [Pelagicoccus sp. SDUM812003]|uniref:FG-GAP-like repeat-containing protein n=1 Tax=Pelagicoccus sp. SDUM812003 TaxID=3041267 RepID=UPI00280EA638|nr:FG-GAP-like repeat-containing protein [Pelagicoccus sp. SDUM812003]MDQ8202473.1 FG-GAP-like repeat-containing protein [Pelagicoccus sp. SDUM812003]